MEQDDFDMPPKGKLSLSCPKCGQALVADPEEATELICIGEHQFDLGTLLVCQSMSATSMIEAGKRLLQEQVNLVRAISSQLWLKRPDDAAKLDQQMDLLEEKIGIIDSAMKPLEPGGDTDGL